MLSPAVGGRELIVPDQDSSRRNMRQIKSLIITAVLNSEPSGKNRQPLAAKIGSVRALM